MLDPADTAWPVDRPELTAHDVVTIDPDEPVIHRVWDPRTGETVEAVEISPDDGEVTIEPGGTRAETVDTLYAVDPDGGLSYLFDLGTTQRLADQAREAAHETSGHRYARSFGGRSVTVSARTEAADPETTAVEIPYSLYHHSRRTNLDGRTAAIPTPADNRFDPDIHGPFVDALAETVDAAVGDAPAPSGYEEVAVLAEFVQSIPHVTDWESKDQITYVRTPAEALTELKADCKDASLLLYHLLVRFGYDPALVFLVGDMAAATLAALDIDVEPDGTGFDLDKTGDETSAVGRQLLEYPHHLAVVVPRDQLTPIPAAVDELATFSRGDREYVYVESTNRQPPGTYVDAHPRVTSVIYRTRREFVERLAPLG